MSLLFRSRLRFCRESGNKSKDKVEGSSPLLLAFLPIDISIYQFLEAKGGMEWEGGRFDGVLLRESIWDDDGICLCTIYQ